MKTVKILALAIFLGTALLPARAHAQSSEDQAAARSLFDEGRRLLKAGKLTEACPKLEAAARIYASPGILLNLGDCYEKSDRTASAWTQFGESASAADRAGRADQQAEARRRQAAVEPKLSRMVIVVAHEAPGLVLSRDGTDLAPAAWGSPIPVDPGAHTVRARADGREPWETSVTVNEPGKTVTFEVPALKASSGAPPPAVVAQPTPAPSLPETPVDGASSSARPPVVGIVLIGAGAAVAIAGVVLMGVESSKASSARSDDTPASSQASVDKFNATKTPWAIGLGGVIAGGVAAAVGVVLVTTHHKSTTGELRASPWVTAGGGGLTVGRAW